jgi:hypothetical protein
MKIIQIHKIIRDSRAYAADVVLHAGGPGARGR